MPDAPGKIAPRSFQMQGITEFKGLNADNGVYNGYGGDEQEAHVLTNFNVTSEGYLQKRRGLEFFCTLPANCVHAQYVGQLSDLYTRTIWLYWSDGASLWRCNQNGGAVNEVRMETNGNYLGGVASVFTVGTPGNFYNGAALSTAGGIIGIYGSTPYATVGWIGNSPKGDRGLMFKNRCWVINSRVSGGNESRLYFSGVGNLSDWTAGGSSGGGNIYIDVADGDFLSGMVPYNDNLILFKSKKTFSFTADGDPTNWTYRLISDRVGCVGHQTIKVINGFMYFLSADGIYKTDGTTYHLISEPINDLLKGYHIYNDPTSMNNMSAIFYDNKYILFVSSDSGMADQAVVYDIPTEQWTLWDFDKERTGITVLGAVRLSHELTDRMIVGSWGQRNLWKMDTTGGFRDNKHNIRAVWQGRRQDFGDPITKKRNHLVSVACSRETPAPIGYVAGEQTVRPLLNTTDAVTYVGNAVMGERYVFTRPGSITGVEFYSPAAPTTANYEIAIWEPNGGTRHRLKLGPCSNPTTPAGWHSVYFDTPFPVNVGAWYMIAVGYPSIAGAHNRAYATNDQATITSGAITLVTDGVIHFLDAATTGYPASEIPIIPQPTWQMRVTKLSPLFVELVQGDPGGVTIETIADDSTVVTTTEIPAKLSEKLIKGRGAGYGRYFQTKVTDDSGGPFSIYGIQWMNETRGIQPNSGPNKNS